MPAKVLSPALTALAACVALSACAEFPELDQRISPQLAAAPVPDLIPLAPLIAQAGADGAAGAATAETTARSLSGRVAALNARAARLRGPVLPPATRARLLRGVR
ncbi:hypothetical protein [Pseudooctadecabacter jejudonensis]|uniref:Uncharacterized protein n=1 Tax=Pseudooctadecabacter jejudonensis TaxID=1391910 RepID=A0A1Y5SKY5_9RHOB|nr:hypothetical protein [Pseudooctadecabacter jejudonensis]SLN40249.1 hypothetical protein PSJ8397_01996 [Pseudooctadecabacter jejudonensis]